MAERHQSGGGMRVDDKRLTADIGHPDQFDPGFRGPGWESAVYIGKQARAVQHTAQLGGLLP